MKVGDTLTVSVLGVEITAEIASTRKIDWQSLGFNFAILFAPGTLEAAPYSYMATLSVAPAQDRAVEAAVARDLPTASVIRVKDVLGQVGELLGQLSAAIRAAASVTVAAGIAVLIGALAAGAQARTYDAVLLKTARRHPRPGGAGDAGRIWLPRAHRLGRGAAARRLCRLVCHPPSL